MTYGHFLHARDGLYRKPDPFVWPSFQHDDHVRLWKLKLALEAFEAAANRMKEIKL